PASMAMQLASEGTWRRLLTDPATGVVTEAGTRRYEPPARVRETVLARDRTCWLMGCSMPAHRCDLDHDTKYRDGGETSVRNLSAKSRAHHAIKDDPDSGFTTAQLPGGVVEWRTPTGHTYRTDPPSIGPITDTPSGTGDGPAGAAYAAPDPPPF
ncbi:MAG TPA: HNH endonuclease signature motif containing protein, partial [Pseudonocardiaceae bacterium]|nr:HNH endonuclease signature motif containing protein [Pseudonocardiaceae bacterium]